MMRFMDFPDILRLSGGNQTEFPFIPLHLFQNNINVYGNLKYN